MARVYRPLHFASIILTFLVLFGYEARSQTPRLASDAEAPKGRRALLIGNEQYAPVFDTLKSQAKDVEAVDKILTSLHFVTTCIIDADRTKMVEALATFQLSIAPGDVVLFYYSGHATQVDGQNYLLPVRMNKPRSNFEITSNAIPLKDVRTALSPTDTNLIILDACRTLSGLPNKGAPPGLAPMTARGTLIVFAADEGQDAKDNYKDALSLFTTFLVSELSKPDLPLCALFEAIRRSVDSASFQAQTPFVYDGIIGNFIFNHQTDAEAVRRVETLGGNQLPKKVLATVAAEKDPNTVAAFIARYPNSSSAGKAKGILTDLMSSTTTAAGVLPLQINDDLRGENLDADTNYRLVAEAADRAYKAGDYGRALNGYRKLANTKQDDGWITYNLANCELQLKQYGDAIKTFDTAIALKPDNPWAYYNRGVAHHLSGNLSAAIKDYKKALQLMPLYAAGYNNLAIAERESGDLKSAEIDASKSIELDPNYAPAYFNRSVIYSIQNRKVAAQQDLNRGNALTIPKKVG